MVRSSISAAILSLTVLLSFTQPGIAADKPWDLGPFESDPRDLLIAAAAESAPDDADILVLLDEQSVIIDEEYRRTTRKRLVYRVVTENGADWWGQTTAAWAPWFQNTPRLQARVILKDGTVLDLDPATINEAPATEGRNIYSDRKVLQAPLPGIAPGAVVEEVSWIEESRPFAVGTAYANHQFSRRQKVIHSRLVVEAPAGWKMNWVARGLNLEPGMREEGSRAHWEWSGGPYEPVKFEPNTPRDVYQLPYVAVSTGKNWSELARDYEKIVEGRLEGADVEALLQDLPGNLKGRDLIAELVERLHRNIRYTGLEFGEASIVPWRPEEVVERGYGDCKDKASLLAAMLRAKGIDADVVLIRAGSHYDVDEEVPSLSVFDHAIVYVPEEDLYIDATASFSPAGTLPVSDQDRKVLVADRDTKGLQRTPIDNAAQNRFEEERTIRLRELGPASVREVSTVTGQWEARFRSSYDGMAESSLREAFQNYLKSEYGADELSQFVMTDTRDLTEPFRLELASEEIDLVTTSLEEGYVVIPRSSFFGYLPEDLVTEPADDAEPREHDFVFDMPMHGRWVYRVEAPAGFDLETLPDGQEVRLGSMTFSEQWSEDDGAAIGRFVLDTGERRISPQELEETRKAILRLAGSDPVYIQFRNIAQSRIAEGDLEGAFAELARLVEARPEDGLVRARRALGLLSAGIGAAARAEIDLAIDLDPENGVLHRLEGWILQHDLLGRLRSPGMDRSGASAAYARAMELDEDDYEALFDRAILAEHDDHGVRYSNNADLDTAIDLYENGKDGMERYPGLKGNPPYALLYAGEFDKLDQHLEKNGNLAEKYSLLVAGELARSGVGAIDRAVAKVVTRDQRESALTSAADMLTRMRLYPEAAAAVRAAAKGSASGPALLARAGVLDKVKRVELSRFDDSMPESVVWRLGTFVLSDDPIAALESALSPAVLDHMTHDDLQKSLDIIRATLSSNDLPLEVVMDIGFSLANIRVAESFDDDLARVEMVVSGTGKADVTYAVRYGQEMKAVPAGEKGASVGIEVLRFIEEGDIARARWILDQERKQIKAVPEDLYSEPMLASLWNAGQEANADQMKLAALSLVSPELAEKTAERLLKVAHGIDRTKISDGLMLDLFMASYYVVLKDWVRAYEHAGRVAESSIGSDLPYLMSMQLLGKLGRLEDARALAEKRREAEGGDEWRRGLAAALGESGTAVDEALALLQQIFGTAEAKANDYNNAAWFAAAIGRADEEMLELGRQAVKMTASSEPASLNTLAVLYAEAGYLREALQLTWQGMTLEGASKPGPENWLVIGMIAERLNELTAAKSAYENAIEMGAVDGSFMSSASFAQRRLATIGEQ